MSYSLKHDTKTAAANGRPAKCHYRGVHKRPGGRYGVQIANPGKETSFWLGTFDTAEQAALVYDSAARQLQGDKAITNFPNPNHLLCPEAALPPKALEVRLSRRYSSGDATTGPMLMYDPATEALELSSYSSARHAAAGPMCMYDPPAPLPPEALELSSYSSGRHAAAGPMFMYHPEAPLPPEALELSLSSYSGGDAATGPMCMYDPPAPLPPEALELSLSSYSSGGDTAAEPMFMYDHPAAPLPQEALELSLSSYSSSGHVANGPMFMYHQGMINNDIHNNVDMSYETSVGGSSNSGYSGCWKSKNLELGLNFPPQ